MRMRGLGLALLVGAMLPGASRAQSTPVPGALKPYVKDGTFDSGDFGWMAGRFATEGTAARAAWESVEAYKDACIAAATGQAKAELAAMGAESANLPPRSYGDEMCRAITAAMVIDAASEAERAALPARLAEARGSDERCVGKEVVSKCSSRWVP